MTVKRLSRLQHLQKMINDDEALLARLEARLEPGGGISSGMPQSPTFRNKMEEIVPQIANLRTLIEREKAEYIAELITLKKYIRTVDDYQMRRIMSYRFVELLTWDQMAARIGGGNTAASVRMAFTRFLKQTQRS